MPVISIRSLNKKINAWFMQPEPSSAGSAGLFRIIYSCFYLWHLSVHSADFLSNMPSVFLEYRVFIVKYFFPDFGASLSPLFYYTLESLLVAALVLLAFGYKTRVATITVLLIGSLLEALATSVDGKRTLLPMVFYVPLFMAIVNSWAHTYSIDSLLRKRRGEPVVDTHADNWIYFLPARALLIVFSVLYFGSAVLKVAFGGAWLTHFDMMAYFFLNRNVEAAVYDLPLNKLAPFIAQTPLIYLSVHITTLVFETFFCISLINRQLRYLIIATALLFHAVNALWLVVTVTPILIGYGIFINWQAIADFFFPTLKQKPLTIGISPKLLVTIALFSATITGLLWHNSREFRALFNLYGLIDWRTIWYPILPISLVWLVAILVRFRQPAKV